MNEEGSGSFNRTREFVYCRQFARFVATRRRNRARLRARQSLDGTPVDRRVSRSSMSSLDCERMGTSDAVPRIGSMSN